MSVLDAIVAAYLQLCGLLFNALLLAALVFFGALWLDNRRTERARKEQEEHEYQGMRQALLNHVDDLHRGNDEKGAWV